MLNCPSAGAGVLSCVSSGGLDGAATAVWLGGARPMILSFENASCVDLIVLFIYDWT